MRRNYVMKKFAVKLLVDTAIESRSDYEMVVIAHSHTNAIQTAMRKSKQTRIYEVHVSQISWPLK
jgi:hypothetical protein